MRLLLASQSPRRAELLAAAGFSFDTVVTSVDERVLPGEAPGAHVARLASAKSLSAGTTDPDVVVVGADTVVVIGGCILGKPQDDLDAARMLGALSGRTHEVLTGVSVRHAGRERCGVSRSLVTFAQLDPGEIAWYVASGEPRDKAGAYGVQGLASRFIERVDGSYTNVVGLPVALVYRLLVELGTGGRWLTARDK